MFPIFWPLHISGERGDDAKNLPPNIVLHMFFHLKMSYSEQCDACFRSDSVTRVICFWDGWTHIFSPDGDTRPQFSDDGIRGKIIIFSFPVIFSPTWQFFLQFSFFMHQPKRERYMNNTTRWNLFSSTFHILNFNLFVKSFIWGFQFHVWCWFWCLAQFRTTLLLLNNFKKNIKIVFSEFKSGSIQARAALFAKSTGCDVSKRKKELQLD